MGGSVRLGVLKQACVVLWDKGNEKLCCVAKLGFLACQQGNTNVRFMIYKKNHQLLFELEMSVET